MHTIVIHFSADTDVYAFIMYSLPIKLHPINPTGKSNTKGTKPVQGSSVPLYKNTAQILAEQNRLYT